MIKVSIFAKPKTKGKGHYIVIPDNVRRDKSLTSNHKILYGEIAALCLNGGSCWPYAIYFADALGVDSGTITCWFKELAEKHYIVAGEVLTINRLIYTETPSYFLIIPPKVLGDKSLTSDQKLLYGEISALCIKGSPLFCDKQLCKRFAGAIGVNANSVKLWLKTLAQKGYIEAETVEAF